MSVKPSGKPVTAQVTSANAPSALDLIRAAMKSAPSKKQSNLDKTVLLLAKEEGFDYEHETAGKKAAFTRKVKDAIKASGVTL
jgi:hypothetical protein